VAPPSAIPPDIPAPNLEERPDFLLAGKGQLAQVIVERDEVLGLGQGLDLEACLDISHLFAGLDDVAQRP
jgi:hypothetical protein